MGHPDIAFAILKDGISQDLLSADYLSKESIQLLEKNLPFLSGRYKGVFATAFGIHRHGSGLTEGSHTPYQFSDIVGRKMEEMAKVYGVSMRQTKNDTINAVEDLICDEMALETSMEGTRFTDLLRLWSHKQQDNTYMSDWGTAWLNRKLSIAKGFEVTADKWFLPFN